MSTFALTGPISDLLDEPIVERSVNAMVHCPFHEDRTPSFSIHLEEGIWHCFSCGESGTLSRLYKSLGKDVDPNVRIYKAKQTAQAPIVKRANFASLANRYIQDLRSGEGVEDVARFVRSRGIRPHSLHTFGVGFSKERNAISFPYADREGRVTGIKYRYGNGFKASEPGSSYGLFGLSEAIGKQEVIICEGESDTLAVHSMYGEVLGVCGTSGASVSDSQWSRFAIDLLFARRIYLGYDADSAGDKAAEAAMRMLGDERCIRVRPPDGMDLAEFLFDGGRLGEIGVE